MEPEGDGEEKERDVAGAERVLPALLSRKKKRREESARGEVCVTATSRKEPRAAEIT